jgi:hypothetical protein
MLPVPLSFVEQRLGKGRSSLKNTAEMGDGVVRQGFDDGMVALGFDQEFLT